MKNSVIRSALLIALAALIAFSCACSKSGEQNTPKVQKTCEELYQEVYAVSGFGAMTPVPKRDYIEVYGINANNFADCVWYTSENPALNADEVAIFRLENKDYKEVLVSLLQKHIDQRLNVAQTYSPEEASKLENVEIATAENSSGCWVYYCIGSEYTRMMGVLRTIIG